MSAIRRILCPIDFSATSLKALRYAAEMAAGGAELLLLHAFDLPQTLTYDSQQQPADPKLREQLDKVEVKPPAAKVFRLLHAGLPGEVICWTAQQQNCDLIVLGTHGRTGLKHLLLGSVAEHVIRHARCPVLTVRDRPADEPPLTEPLVMPLKAPRMM